MVDYTKDIEKLYEDFKIAEQINTNNLFKILEDNKDTYYGKLYSFSDIKTIEDYQKKVPLSTYSNYEEHGNTYSYEVGYHLATSGTLGKQKKYTVSKLAMERYTAANYIMPFYLKNIPNNKGINASIFRSVKKETLLSCALYDYLYTHGYLNLDDYYDKDFLFMDTEKNIPYIKMYIALAHKDVRFFDSIFLYDLTLIFNYLKDNWMMMLNDIKNKAFSVDLSEHERMLLSKVEYTKDRIDEIEKIFNEGFDCPIIKKLFPDLQFVSGVGGGKYQVYDEKLKEFIGDTDMFYYIFAQTECSMAVPLKMNEARFAMIPTTCFMEYRDIDNDEIFLPSQIKIGKEYEPIVTTFSGIYRYHTGDKVKIVDFIDKSPIVEVKGRLASIINIAGEKIDDADITLAMSKLEDSYNFNQFAVGIDYRVYPNRYILFIESDADNLGMDVDFDTQLRVISPDYDDLRIRQAISLPIVINKTSIDFKNTQKGQIKPKVVLSDSQVQEWINE